MNKVEEDLEAKLKSLADENAKLKEELARFRAKWEEFAGTVQRVANDLRRDERLAKTT